MLEGDSNLNVFFTFLRTQVYEGTWLESMHVPIKLISQAINWAFGDGRHRFGRETHGH